LRRLGQAAVPPLKQLLTDPDPERRQEGVHGLFLLDLAAAEARPELLAAIADPDSWVRVHAVRATGTAGFEAAEVLPALRGALHDPEAEVRAVALQSLTYLGRSDPPSVLPDLLSVLDDPAALVRDRLAKALPHLTGRSEQARAQVQAALKKLAQDPHPHVREEAEEGLEYLQRETDRP
jgi:HEAT repeat protein